MQVATLSTPTPPTEGQKLPLYSVVEEPKALHTSVYYAKSKRQEYLSTSLSEPVWVPSSEDSIPVATPPNIVLEEGDSIYFNPNIPHGQRCGGDEPATFLTMITEV